MNIHSSKPDKCNHKYRFYLKRGGVCDRIEINLITIVSNLALFELQIMLHYLELSLNNSKHL